MAIDLNQVTIAGNLGRDAELRFMGNGRAKLRFSLAHNRNYTDKNGTRQSKTTWINCTMWGDSAEKLEPYLKRGKQIVALGELESYTSEQKVEGTTATINVDKVELNVRRIIFLSDGEGQNGQRETTKAETFEDDDVPF